MVGIAIFSKYALDDGKHIQMLSSNVGDQSKVDWIRYDEDLIDGRNPNRPYFELIFCGKAQD